MESHLDVDYPFRDIDDLPRDRGLSNSVNRDRMSSNLHGQSSEKVNHFTTYLFENDVDQRNFTNMKITIRSCQNLKKEKQ